MPDGRMHGVHVWIGPADDEPPERPIAGPLKWDMTLGVATDTPESLANIGRNVETEDPEDRAFAECWPAGELKPNEGKALAAAVRSEPGHTVCDTWDGTDWQGNYIRVSFVARNGLETGVERPRSPDRAGDELAGRRRRPGRNRPIGSPSRSCRAWPRPECIGRCSTRTPGRC